MEFAGIVTDAVSQSTAFAELGTIDGSNIVSLGDKVFSTSDCVESFTELMVKRIFEIEVLARAYKSKLGFLIKRNISWGAILERVKFQLVSPEEDPSFNLKDGESIDMYKINKPKGIRKLFYTEQPYMYTLTKTHYGDLKRSFLNEHEFDLYWGGVAVEMQNSIEVGEESMARLLLNSYMAELVGTDREIKLVTEYNAEYGAALTPNDKTVLKDESFLRFMVGKMKDISFDFTDMLGEFNDASTTEHTPKAKQKLVMLHDVHTKLETNVLYSAFNKSFVDIDGFEELSHWQAYKDKMHIKVNKVSEPATIVDKDGVISTLFDEDALGICILNEWLGTTPLNTAGGYMNTHVHKGTMKYVDLSCNGVIFTLA